MPKWLYNKNCGEDRSAFRHMQCAVFSNSEKAHDNICSEDTLAIITLT